MVKKSLVFHSYKGGTGKTTIAANLSALLANRGYRTLLLDLDLYAPSLHTYFEIEPRKWINDFLLEQAEAEDVMVDLTPMIASLSKNTKQPEERLRSPSEDGIIDEKEHKNNDGRLWVGFSNPKKEEVYKMEGGKQEKVQLLRRFILLREQLFSQFDADYLVIDTSPGIRYWSINSLAVADILYLTLKSGDLDIVGTKKMAEDLYATFSRFGAKPYLVLNRVAGYCVPHTLVLEHHASSSSRSTTALKEQGLESSYMHSNDGELTSISTKMGYDVISALPCYCDIQFSKKEFLTVLRDPHHPFAKRIEGLVDQSQMKLGEAAPNV